MASYAPATPSGKQLANGRPGLRAKSAAASGPGARRTANTGIPSLGRYVSTGQEPRRREGPGVRSARHGPFLSPKSSDRRPVGHVEAVSVVQEGQVATGEPKPHASALAQNNGGYPVKELFCDTIDEKEFTDKVEYLKAQLIKANKAELKAVEVRFKLMAEAHRMYQLVQGMQASYNDSVDTVERAPKMGLSKPQMEFMLRKVAGLRESMGKAEVAAAHAMEAVAEGAAAEVERIHRRQGIEEVLASTVAAEAAAAASAAAANGKPQRIKRKFIPDWVITGLSLASVGLILALQNFAWLAGFIWGTAGFLLGFLT